MRDDELGGGGETSMSHGTSEPSDAKHESLSIFICFRYADGKEHAERLFRHLNRRVVTLDRGSVRLDVYYSARAPGAPDFREVQMARLRTARAMIFVLTDEARIERADTGTPDWMHAELRWWSSHRKRPPIIVQSRQFAPHELPEIVQVRWPFANRLDLSPDEQDPETMRELVERIVAGIRISEEGYRLQELERLRRLTRWLTSLAAAAIVLAAIAIIFYSIAEDARIAEAGERSKADVRARIATSNRLALASRAIRPNLPNRAIVLAAEGVGLTMRHGDGVTPASEEALRVALQRSSGQALPGHFGPVTCLDGGARGHLLASASHDMTIRLWDLDRLDKAPSVLIPGVGSIYCCRFSPDGSLLAAGGANGGISLFDLKDPGEPTMHPLRHGGWVSSVQFSPQGKRLATAGSDGRVLAWCLDDLSAAPIPVATSEEGAADLVWIDDSRLAVATGKSLLAVTLHDDGSPRSQETLWEGDASRVAYSAAASRLVVSAGNGLHTWSVANDAIRLERDLPVPDGMMVRGLGVSLSVSPDGKWAAACAGDTPFLDTSGGSSPNVLFWSLAPGSDASAKPLPGHSGVVSALAFSSDSQYLASGGSDHSLMIWRQTAPGIFLPIAREIQGHDGRVRALAFLESRAPCAWLASGANDGLVHLYRCPSQTDAYPGFSSVDAVIPVPGVLGSMELARRAGVLVTTSSEGGRAWRVGARDAQAGSRDPPPEYVSLAAGEGSAWSIRETAAVSSDGHLVASTVGKSQSLWDLSAWLDRRGAVVRHDLPAGNAIKYLFIGDPVASLLVVAPGNRDAELFDVSTREPKAVPFSASGSPPWTLAASGDGSRLGAGTWSNEVYVWDVGHSEDKPIRLQHDPDHDDRAEQSLLVSALTLSDTGEVLASGSLNGVVSAWRMTSAGKAWRLRIPLRHTGAVTAAALTKQGDRLITSDSTGSVALWQVQLEAVVLLREWRDRDAPLGRTEGNDLDRRLVVSADGKYAASSGADHRVHLWSIDQPNLDPVLVVSTTSQVIGLAFSDDDSRLFVATMGGPVVATLIAPEKLLAAAAMNAGRNLTWEEWDEFCPGEPYARTFPNLPVHRSKISNDFQQYARLNDDGTKAAARRQLTELVDESAGIDDPYLWSALCWHGSLRGDPGIVLAIGERAVRSAGKQMQGFFEEARGIALARLGDRNLAARSLRAYCEWAEASHRDEQVVSEHRRWINELESGSDPFDAATIGVQLSTPPIERDFPFRPPESW